MRQQHDLFCFNIAGCWVENGLARARMEAVRPKLLLWSGLQLIRVGGRMNWM